jgi:hypothetical protein
VPKDGLEIQDWRRLSQIVLQGCREIDVDYQVRHTGNADVGMGVFALRDFAKNDIIISERPLVKAQKGRQNFPVIPASASYGFDLLLPKYGSLQEKLDRNAMECIDEDDSRGEAGEIGLFLTTSRINHCCLGNATHQFMEHRDIRILVASRPIMKGEEITFSYLGSHKSRDERRERLQRYPYQFVCKCPVCTSPELETKLDRAEQLDSAILDLGSLTKIEAALEKGKALIAIYDELGMSSWCYQRTYHDLFQVAITKKRYCKDGERFIRLAYEANLAYTKDEQHPTVIRFKDLIARPENHQNYLALR